MKILFPIRSFYPAQTGPANAVYFLAKELVKNKVEVFVITTTLGIKNLSGIILNKWVKVDGINVYYSDKYYYNLLPSNLFQINIPKIDLIHFSSFFDQINLYFLFLSLKRNIPYIYTPSGELLPSALAIKSLKKKVFMNNTIIKYLMKKTHIHVTSEFEFNEVKKHLNKNKNKFYNIPNIMEFNIDKNQIYEFPYAFKYMLYLGRIARIKNIELLIDVYSKLSFNEKIKLIIAGDINDDIKYSKELKEKVKQLSLEEKIIFTDKRVEGLEKEQLYNDAELFILPSKSENFGMVILEALAHGISVVTTKGTPWESLNKNKCGYWVNMDLKSIKNAIESYFSLSDTEKESMKEKGLLLANEFSSEKLISKYIDMYKTILKI